MSWLPEEERPIAATDEGLTEAFDQAPVKCRCPHCHGNIITFIDYEPSWITYTMAVIVILVSGWFAICVIPLLWPVFKDVVHYCPRCLNVLARRSRVQIIRNKESEDVMTLKFGNCAMVLSRRYLCFFITVTCCIMMFHLYRTHNNQGETSVLDLRMGEISPLSWDDFLRDCGVRSSLGNPIHVHAAFDEKYKEKTFQWSGTVEAIDLGWNYYFWRSASRIWVGMPHHQYMNVKADLDLLFLPSDSKDLSLDDLKPKERITFIATFATQLGRRGIPHPMRLHSLERLKKTSNEAEAETSHGTEEEAKEKNEGDKKIGRKKDEEDGDKKAEKKVDIKKKAGKKDEEEGHLEEEGRSPGGKGGKEKTEKEEGGDEERLEP